MENGKEALSFGRYLQAIRQKKNISLEQVAAQTRIGLGNLILVEQEDHEQLPAKVFVRGFLRSYAAAIGADGDEAVRRYESRLDVVHKLAESEASIGKSKTRLWLKMIISLGLLLGIIAVSIVIIPFMRHTSEIEESSQQQTQAPAVRQPIADQVKPAVNPSPESTTAVSPKMLLKINALENTWIKVIIDEKEPAKYTLNPGDEMELEASQGFNLLIGSASGIKLLLNDKAISIPGDSGQVVTMHLP